MLRIRSGIRPPVVALALAACFVGGPAGAGDSAAGAEGRSGLAEPVANLDPGEAEPDPEPLASGGEHRLDPGEAEPDPEPVRQPGPVAVDPAG